MYEVILMLEKESDSAHNPSFIFGSYVHALQQLETFIENGYGAFIIKLEDGENINE